MNRPTDTRIKRARSGRSGALEVSGDARGTQRFGPYRLHEKIGDGGFAEVFLARREGVAHDPDLVLKRLHQHLGEDQESVDMFLTEARLMAEFDHPGIVRIYTLDQIEQRWSIVMERVDGGSLGDLFERARVIRQPLPLAASIYVVAQAALALHYAHGLTSESTGRRMGVVHRDVKPDNILVGWDGAVKITDFGCAKATIQNERTRPGIRKGTLDYMSPEQCLGRPLDARSDIFSLGIVLYELVTAKRLYDDAGDAQVMERIAHEVTRPPSWDNPEIDPSLDLIVLRALEKSPADRFGTADDLARSLQWWLDRYAGVDPRAEISAWMREHYVRPKLVAARFRPQVRRRSGGELMLRPGSPPPPTHFDDVESRPVFVAPGRTAVVAADRFTALQSIIARNSNLPPETGSFFGRRAELKALDDAVTGHAQLVSLHGAAGIGKSRLADAWARRRLASPEMRSGGVWLCDIAHVKTPPELCAAVAAVLGLAGGAPELADPEDQISLALAVRGTTLLVLDGPDRLDLASERMLARWCRSAPELEILVCTRRPLETLDAVCVRVPPLPLPSRPAVVADSDAVRLLVARARDVAPDFAVRPDNALAVFELVHQMGGNPQAIELAAARLPLETERDESGQPMRFLAPGSAPRPGGPLAAETLSAAVAWSWDRLDEVQKDVLAQATVFAGGFTAQAAMAVLQPHSGSDRHHILKVIEALKQRSMLRASEAGEQPGRTRYRVVGIARPLARERLLASEQAGLILQRHADHYLWLAEHIGPLCFKGEGWQFLATLRVEQANLEAIVRRALRVTPATTKSARRALRAAMAFEPYIVLRGRYQPWLEQLDGALEAAHEVQLVGPKRALALLARVTALHHLGDDAQADASLDQAAALAQDIEDPVLVARMALARGDRALRAGQGADARKHYRSAVALLDGTDQAAVLAYAYMGLGRAARAEQRRETSESCFSAARRLYHQVGHWHGEAVATAELGALRLELGRHERAEADLRLAIAALRSFGDRRRQARVLLDLGRLALTTGDHETAGRYFVEALELARQIASPQLEVRARDLIAKLPGSA